MSMSPLELTLNPRLDAALRQGGNAWEIAALEEGKSRTLAWLKQRLGEVAKEHDLTDVVSAYFDAADEDERLFARIDLAEMLESEDDVVADALWEATLAHGVAVEDGDLIFEATSHLAAIAEELGDPLAAAEYHIEFLNWRRTEAHTSDPEQVETSFDEIIRLAESDGEPKFAADFTYRQVAYTKLVNADDERAQAGEWEPDGQPYQSWA